MRTWCLLSETHSSYPTSSPCHTKYVTADAQGPVSCFRLAVRWVKALLKPHLSSLFLQTSCYVRMGQRIRISMTVTHAESSSRACQISVLLPIPQQPCQRLRLPTVIILSDPSGTPPVKNCCLEGQGAPLFFSRQCVDVVYTGRCLVPCYPARLNSSHTACCQLRHAILRSSGARSGQIFLQCAHFEKSCSLKVLLRQPAA